MMPDFRPARATFKPLIWLCPTYISAMPASMTPPGTTTLDEIVDNFALLEEWDDRYRYVIELGRGLRPLSERDRSEANKVQGCATQVWLANTAPPHGPARATTA